MDNRKISIQSERNYVVKERKKFNGTIIITDPCYVIKAPHNGTIPDTDDDWSECNYGMNMEKLGIKNYITHNTIGGDWGCFVYNTNYNPKKKIGEFGDDSGMVSVFLLDEVLKYNPDTQKWINEHDWCVTTIKDFKGVITS